MNTWHHSVKLLTDHSEHQIVRIKFRYILKSDITLIELSDYCLLHHEVFGPYLKLIIGILEADFAKSQTTVVSINQIQWSSLNQCWSILFFNRLAKLLQTDISKTENRNAIVWVNKRPTYFDILWWPVPDGKLFDFRNLYQLIVGIIAK